MPCNIIVRRDIFRSSGKTADNSTTGQNNQATFVGLSRNKQLCQENRLVTGHAHAPAKGSLTDTAADQKEYGADWTNLY